MFDQLTDDANRVMRRAREEALALDHAHIGTEHVLLGIAADPLSFAARDLAIAGVRPPELRAAVVDSAQRGSGPPADVMPFTPRCKRAIELAAAEAGAFGSERVDTEHLLLGLLGVPSGKAAQLLASLGVTLPAVRGQVALRTGTPIPPPVVVKAPWARARIWLLWLLAILAIRGLARLMS